MLQQRGRLYDRNPPEQMTVRNREASSTIAPQQIPTANLNPAQVLNVSAYQGSTSLDALVEIAKDRLQHAEKGRQPMRGVGSALEDTINTVEDADLMGVPTRVSTSYGTVPEPAVHCSLEPNLNAHQIGLLPATVAPGDGGATNAIVQSSAGGQTAQSSEAMTQQIGYRQALQAQWPSHAEENWASRAACPENSYKHPSTDGEVHLVHGSESSRARAGDSMVTTAQNTISEGDYDIWEGFIVDDFMETLRDLQDLQQ